MLHDDGLELAPDCRAVVGSPADETSDRAALEAHARNLIAPLKGRPDVLQALARLCYAKLLMREWFLSLAD